MAEVALHEVPVGLVGAGKSHIIARDLHDAHGQRVENVLEGGALLPGDDRQVVQVHPADGLEVFGFPGVFKADLHALLVARQYAVQRDRLAEVIALELRAADLP